MTLGVPHPFPQAPYHPKGGRIGMYVCMQNRPSQTRVVKFLAGVYRHPDPHEQLSKTAGSSQKQPKTTNQSTGLPG